MLTKELKTIKAPWLIQRGSFKNIPDTEIFGLDSLISYDYMGSAEFEFGALAKSLQEIAESWHSYVWFPLEDIKDTNGEVLYILCSPSQKDEVIEVVHMLSTEEYPHTKEHVGLCEYIAPINEYDTRSNFWWDITGVDPFSSSKLGYGNNWMVCFGDNVRRLVIALNKVCEKRGFSINPAIPLKSNKVIRMDVNFVETHSTVQISYKDGKKTIIVKRNVLAVDNSNDSYIKTRVKTKAGIEKDLDIKIPRSSIRTFVWNALKDLPDMNKVLKE